MICPLKFGTAPTDCTGSARRQINPRQFGTQNQDKDFHYLESNLDGKIGLTVSLFDTENQFGFDENSQNEISSIKKVQLSTSITP